MFPLLCSGFTFVSFTEWTSAFIHPVFLGLFSLRGTSKNDITSHVEPESADFFCKSLDSKYFQLCHNYLVLPLQYGSSCRQYVSNWAWLCSSKTLFTSGR